MGRRGEGGYVQGFPMQVESLEGTSNCLEMRVLKKVKVVKVRDTSSRG